MHAESPSGNADRARSHTRDFRRQDQRSVRDLIQDGLRSRWGSSFDEAANPDTDDLWLTYVDKGNEIVVAEVDGTVVATGILCIEPTPPQAAALIAGRTAPRLRRISVSDDHRRQGLGRLIVEELVRRASDRGFDQVLVSTDTPWTDAIALYESCGFTPIYNDPEETHLLRTVTDH